MLDINLTDSTGKQYRLTNEQGYANLGRFRSFDAGHHDLALFFGHSWQWDHRWTLDWGGRYEYIAVKGNNHISNPNTHDADPVYGGVDGNSATIYDNVFSIPGSVYHFNKRTHSFSYSAGLNYKINNQLAFYGRFAHGQKAPDLAYYFAFDSQSKIENNKPRTQKIDQAEIGLKATTDQIKMYVTPFYSLLSDVYTIDEFRSAGGTPYFPLPLLNSVSTYGLEMEADYAVSSSLHIRTVATFQSAKAKSWDVRIANQPGAQDDSIVHYAGKKADNNPGVIFNVTPSYTKERFYTLLSWKYMGSRPGNVPNTITLPGYSQFDLGIGYNMLQNLSVRININNLFNSEGVMGWSPPAKYLDALDRQGFTKEKRDANPNATFGIVCIQPRAYFLTVTYSF